MEAVLERRSTVSLVLACPSTVRQLKDVSTASARISRRSLAQSGASVRRNASMVAMRGPIMAAPLARPEEVDLPAVDDLTIGDDLGAGVGGHDRPGCRLERLRIGREPGHGLLESRFQAIHGELVADDARGGDEDLLGPAAEECPRSGGGPLRVGQPFRPGRRIGVAGIDHDGADVLGGQSLATPLHRCGTDAVGRERAGRGTGAVGREDRQVEAPRRLDPGLHARCPETARNAEECFGGHDDRLLLSIVRGSSDNGPRRMDRVQEDKVHDGSTSRIAAIHEQGRAGHEARCLGSQEDRRGPQLDRIAPAPRAAHWLPSGLGRPGR